MIAILAHFFVFLNIFSHFYTSPGESQLSSSKWLGYFRENFPENCYFVPLVSRFLEYSLFFCTLVPFTYALLIRIIFCFCKKCDFLTLWEMRKSEKYRVFHETKKYVRENHHGKYLIKQFRNHENENPAFLFQYVHLARRASMRTKSVFKFTETWDTNTYLVNFGNFVGSWPQKNAQDMIQKVGNATKREFSFEMTQGEVLLPNQDISLVVKSGICFQKFLSYFWASHVITQVDTSFWTLFSHFWESFGKVFLGCHITSRICLIDRHTKKKSLFCCFFDPKISLKSSDMTSKHPKSAKMMPSGQSFAWK